MDDPNRVAHEEESADFTERYARLIEEHGNLAAMLGISEHDLDDCYDRALEAYRGGDYALASRLLSALTFVNPREGQLHLATGNALQQLGEHGSALSCFSAAAELLPDDPGVWFRIAECEVTLSHDDEARESLRRCLSLCETSHARPGLYPHAKALMDKLL